MDFLSREAVDLHLINLALLTPNYKGVMHVLTTILFVIISLFCQHF